MRAVRKHNLETHLILLVVALLSLSVVPRAHAITVTLTSTGTLLSPANAWTFYGTATAHTVGVAANSTPPPELLELQRALSRGGACTGQC